MRSFVIVEVEHEDTTDGLDDVLWGLSLTGNIGGMPNGITDYTLAVDLPPFITLQNVNTFLRPQ